MALLQLTITQQATGTVAFVDAKGNPAEVQNVEFSTPNPETIEVGTDPNDPKTVTVKAKAAGAARVDVTADADLGDGVETITFSADVSVTPGRAVGGSIAFGPATEQ